MLYDLIYKDFPAVLMLVWNSFFFWYVGRWSLKRKPRYKMGDAICNDIETVLQRRNLIGNNAEAGMTIIHSRRWLAFGHVWEIKVAQETLSTDLIREG